MRILVTGASGFVGGAVARRLAAEGHQVRAAIRREDASVANTTDRVRVEDLGPAADWTTAVSGIDCVVHAAARVHVMRDSAADPLAEFRRTNVQGTIRLAEQAAQHGVTRFVFVSSIKVNGERTEPGRPFHASDAPNPRDPYGVSKREAEESLRALGQRTGMAIVVVRPVLVHGPGAKGNLHSLMRWLAAGRPIPLGETDNRRSLIGLDNLADLMLQLVVSPAAPGGTFLARDAEQLSTTELIRRLAHALGRRARLLPVPPAILRGLARAAGKPGVAARMLDSLEVDASETRQRLGWSPQVSIDEGLRRMADAFLRS